MPAHMHPGWVIQNPPSCSSLAAMEEHDCMEPHAPRRIRKQCVQLSMQVGVMSSYLLSRESEKSRKRARPEKQGAGCPIFVVLLWLAGERCWVTARRGRLQIINALIPRV